MSVRRVSAAQIRARKTKGERFAMIALYDAPFARIAGEAGIDVLLVGDSLGMTVLGFDSTTPVELDDVVRHTAAVARGDARAHIVGDLPFGSYQSSDDLAVRSAVALVKAGASAVKLEGGVTQAPRIAAITRAGIPVMAHLGVLPQTASLGEGFARKRDRERLVGDLDAVVAAGAYAVVFEMVDAEIAGELTARAPIPTIGIGSGAACDGQVLVMHDILGLYPDSPPFAKRYADLGGAARDAFAAFAADVRETSR